MPGLHLHQRKARLGNLFLEGRDSSRSFRCRGSTARSMRDRKSLSLRIPGRFSASSSMRSSIPSLSRSPAPALKEEGAGLFGLAEVVDETDVVGAFLVLGETVEEILDGGQAPGAGQAGHEDVVADSPNPETESDGFDGSILRHDGVGGLDARGAPFWQPTLGAGPGEVFEPKFPNHRSSLMDNSAGSTVIPRIAVATAPRIAAAPTDLNPG